MTEPIFKIKNLNVFYGEKHALKEVTCDIPQRKVTAVVGPSGCGKSTFLRVLNRMNDLIPSYKHTGSVKLLGDEILDMDPVLLRKHIGMVFQKPNPFPKTIQENVTYGPRIHGIRNRQVLREITEKSLKQAALWDEVKDELKKNAANLSGGQQQRLCIARALLRTRRPFVGRATSALDPIATQRIETLIEELSEKYTIVIVTHNCSRR